MKSVVVAVEVEAALKSKRAGESARRHSAVVELCDVEASSLPPVSILHAARRRSSHCFTMNGSKLNVEGMMLFEQPFARVSGEHLIKLNAANDEHRYRLRTTGRCFARHRRTLKGSLGLYRTPLTTWLNVRKRAVVHRMMLRRQWIR